MTALLYLFLGLTCLAALAGLTLVVARTEPRE